jgi:mRNA interferase RelE/StbE
MKYTITWSRRATRSLRNLEASTRRRVIDRVRDLANDPRPPDCEALRGYPYFRVRVGDYRVVYDIRDEEIRIAIVLVGHRREIYEQVKRL